MARIFFLGIPYALLKALVSVTGAFFGAWLAHKIAGSVYSDSAGNLYGISEYCALSYADLYGALAFLGLVIGISRSIHLTFDEKETKTSSYNYQGRDHTNATEKQETLSL